MKGYLMSKLIAKLNITDGDNYFWLLLALMVLFFCSALFEQLDIAALSQFMGVLLTGTILVAVWSLEQGRIKFITKGGITALLVLLVVGEYTLEYDGLALIQLVFLLLFTLATIVIACRQVLFSGNVDSNKIIGAICIYMFLGIFWSLTYVLVEAVFPGSIPSFEGADWRENSEKAIYFSFVSQTTLGYGDISPAQPMARYLAYMQAVTGQFYIAILVASLIGVRLRASEDG